MINSQETGRNILPPPKEHFIIGGKPLNLRAFLDEPRADPNTMSSEEFEKAVQRRNSYYTDKMQPGDNEALSLLDTLHKSGVKSKDYFTAMPRLFEYAAKKESGFDANLLTVARFLISRAYPRTVHDAGDTLWEDGTGRNVYLAQAYGEFLMIRETIWTRPTMALRKAKLIRHAKAYLYTPWRVREP